MVDDNDNFAYIDKISVHGAPKDDLNQNLSQFPKTFTKQSSVKRWQLFINCSLWIILYFKGK